MPSIGYSIARAWRYPDSTLDDVAIDGTQYEGETDIVVTGANFVNGSTEVSIDGTAYTTVWNSSSQVTVTVPAAEVSGSPLRTSGTKTLTASTGGTSTWTVDAWSVETHLTNRKRCFVATSADCAGVTDETTKFQPWTDRLGNGNMVGFPTAGTNTMRYYPTSIFSSGLGGVNAGSAGSDSVGQINSSGSVGSDFFVILVTVTIIDAEIRRCFRYSSGTGTFTLQTKGSSNELAQAVFTPTLGTPLTLEAPLEHVERAVIAMGWSVASGAFIRKNLDAATTGAVNQVTSSSSTMVYGIAPTDVLFGDWWTGILVTCDAVPSSTEQDRAARELMIRAGIV